MELHYNAFISYRHAPLDSRVAADIQHSLERFHVPREIQKRTGKRKIERVFRDKEELPITSDLNDDIAAALRHSDFLIVICSTNTASSIWVRREIEAFLRGHDRRHVLTVLADGEPQDVIPDILRYEQVEVRDGAGAIHTERRPIEPLSCDWRIGRARARREELPRLAAALLGCAYDELRQRQRRRRVRQLVAGFSAALALVSAVAAYAVDRAVVIARQAEQIEAEYRNTLITQSRYLAEKSRELLGQGDRMGAIQVALSALPAGEADQSRPLVTEALCALSDAVYPYHIAQPDAFLAKCTLQTDGNGGSRDPQTDMQQLSPGGSRWMTADKSGQIYVFDLETDSLAAVLAPQSVVPDAEEPVFIGADLLSEERLVLYTADCAVCWDLETDSAVWRTEYGQTTVMGFSDADTLADREHRTLTAALVGFGGFCLCRMDADTGEMLSVIRTDPPASGLYGLSCRLALSPDGTRAAVGFADNDVRREDDGAMPAHLLLADLVSGEHRMVTVKYGDVASLAFLSDDQLCVFTTDVCYADYIHSTFAYAVERYAFDGGDPLWSSEGEVNIGRGVGHEAKPTSEVRPWTRELSDGRSEELLIAQFAGRLLLLAPEDGEVLRTADFPADILDISGHSAGQLFLAAQNGQLLVYMPAGDAYGEMGSVAGSLRSAAFVPERGEYLLALEGSRNTVVMSSGLEDPGLATVQLDAIASVDYALGDGGEYRIVREYVHSGEGSPERLLFYRPLTDTPFAVTDAEGWIKDLDILHTGEGEDVCCYLVRADDTLTLCGWGLESDRKLFSYDLETTSGELLGSYGDQVLLYTGASLRLVDPAAGTEKNIEAPGYAFDSAFSQDGRYLAVLGGEELGLLDLEQWAWAELPEQLRALHGDSDLGGDLSLSPDGSRLAVWANGQLSIVDMKELAIEQRVDIPCRSSGYSLFLGDSILLVYGDSGRLTTWDLDARAVVMEDPYDDIQSGRELIGWDGFFQAGGAYPCLYTYSEDGRFARYLTVGYGCVSPSGSEVLSFYNEYGSGSVTVLISNTAFRVYPLYSLDELTAKAGEILDGRTLTDAEKIKYFIDS